MHSSVAVRGCKAGIRHARRERASKPDLNRVQLTPESSLPSIWQQQTRRRAGTQDHSGAAAAHRHGRIKRCHRQLSCLACCAARSCSESSRPTHAMERMVVLADNVLTVCEMLSAACRQRCVRRARRAARGQALLDMRASTLARRRPPVKAVGSRGSAPQVARPQRECTAKSAARER
jgi:hypothetical protein